MIHAAGAGTLAALGLGFYAWFYAPRGREIDACLKRIEQLRALMASNEQIAEEHRRLETRVTALRSAAAGSRDRMPRRVSSQEFLDKAMRIAELMDLRVELCTAAPPQSHPGHTQIEVTCRLVGGYASICRFLAAIDQLPQISKVSRLDIDTAGNSREYPTNVIFQLYYRGELNDTEQKRGGVS
jgi:Tfp pilus assembly protein PilO